MGSSSYDRSPRETPQSSTRRWKEGLSGNWNVTWTRPSGPVYSTQRFNTSTQDTLLGLTRRRGWTEDKGTQKGSRDIREQNMCEKVGFMCPPVSQRETTVLERSSIRGSGDR